MAERRRRAGSLGSSPIGNQTLDLANLVLAGSKQSIEYGVRSTAERSTGGFYAGKGDAGLRFDSFIFNYIASGEVGISGSLISF